MEYKYCPKCGTSNELIDLYCSSCGADLKEIRDGEFANEEEFELRRGSTYGFETLVTRKNSSDIVYSIKPSSVNSSHRIIMILIVILLFILGGATVLMPFSSGTIQTYLIIGSLCAIVVLSFIMVAIKSPIEIADSNQKLGEVKPLSGFKNKNWGLSDNSDQIKYFLFFSSGKSGILKSEFGEFNFEVKTSEENCFIVHDQEGKTMLLLKKKDISNMKRVPKNFYLIKNNSLDDLLVMLGLTVVISKFFVLRSD